MPNNIFKSFARISYSWKHTRPVATVLSKKCFISWLVSAYKSTLLYNTLQDHKRLPWTHLIVLSNCQIVLTEISKIKFLFIYFYKVCFEKFFGYSEFLFIHNFCFILIFIYRTFYFNTNLTFSVFVFCNLLCSVKNCAKSFFSSYNLCCHNFLFHHKLGFI